jgi:hypothetical protein
MAQARVISMFGAIEPAPPNLYPADAGDEPWPDLYWVDIRIPASTGAFQTKAVDSIKNHKIL